MAKALEMNIRGLKCDAKGCNYINTEIPADEYDSWLNKPCPLCGANLLTEEDLIATKFLMQMVKLTNSIYPAPEKDEPLYQGSFKMNGTGLAGMSVEIKPIESNEKGEI